MAERYTYKLPNGTTVEVDERAYIALHQLESAMNLLGSGGTSHFALVETDLDGRDRSFILLGECDHLETLHAALLQQSSVVLALAKSWRGNVAPECHSQARH